MSDNSPKPRILVLGDAMLDLYTTGSVDRISPEYPVPVVKVEQETARPGGAAAVAQYVKRLLPSAAVYLCAPGSGDNNGQFIQAALNDIGVGVFLRTCLDRTTTKRRYVDHSGRHVMRADQEHDTPLDKIRKGMMAGDIVTLVREPWDIVLVSDYGKGACQPEILARLVPELKAGKAGATKIIVDPALGADPLKYEEPYCIVPNRREAASLVGGVIEQPLHAAKKICKLAGAESCLLKLDRGGAVLVAPDTLTTLPAMARHVADVTGAGDMVLAAIGAGLACGLEMHQAAHIAMGAAALHVEGLKDFTLAGARARVRDRFTGAIPAPIVGVPDFIANVASAARYRGLRVAFTNGCFDLFHAGHLHLLEQARAQGDLLIVAVNTDESVRRLKGPARPARPLEQRVKILQSTGLADVVVAFGADTPADLIASIKPDVLVKGDDTKPPIPGADLLPEWGGRLHLVPALPVASTSDILARGV